MSDSFQRLVEAGRTREGLRQAVVEIFDDYDQMKLPEEMAEAVYDHFRWTDFGDETWCALEGPTRPKIDYVMDRMREYYVDREGWFTGDEWLLISEQIGDQVCEGVF